MHTMAEKFYSDEQAQEILRLAAQGSAGGAGISRSQLLETAAELGIRPEEVLHAEQALAERQQLDEDRLAYKKQKQRKLQQEASAWISGAILLYGIAYVTRGFHIEGLLATWPKWPVGFWTLKMVKESVEFFMDMTVNRESNFEHWRQKRRKDTVSADSFGINTTGLNLTFTGDIKQTDSQIEINQVRS